MRGLVPVFLFLVSVGWASGADSLPDGLKLRIGNEEVEVHVATPHAFRLHIEAPSASPALPGPSSAVFLSGAEQPATPFSPVTEGNAVGLKTSFGEILVDPVAQTWSLRDAKGTMLAEAGQLGAVVQAPICETPKPRPGVAPVAPLVGDVLQFTVGPASNQPHPLFYGSGTIPKRGSLTQDRSDSRQGNGEGSLPQYWSTAGYGLLAMGPYGNYPAAWQREDQGGVKLAVPGHSVDLYLMPASNLYDWLRDDAELTGFAPVAPRWSFGYMQSRWGWTDRQYIENTLAHFRRDQLPVDAFIIDFEWYTPFPDYEVPAQGQAGFVDFGWNPALFPDPAHQVADYLKEGVHLVGIRKPRLGNEGNLARARGNGWIQPPDVGDTSKTQTRNLDYSLVAVRDYWKENNLQYLQAGMAGFWNDEGELVYSEYNYWNLTELEMFHEFNPGARFWSLNRSLSPGLQRFGAAVWTGDIRGDWATLARTPGELLQLGLAGLPYSTCDIGGFYKPDKSPELFTRWMEAGVFYPEMRSHSTRLDQPHFPWLYGPESEAAVRKALDLRYQLIPYYYSLAHQTYETAAPIMRPLVMEFPDDPAVANLTNEWLMGRGLLAAPIFAAGGARSVYLPRDTWYELGTAHATAGPTTLQVTEPLDGIPVYVRAGTLLPLGPVIQSTSLPADGPLELQVYPGHDAKFTLVEDDGATTVYQRGAIRKTTFTWDDRKRSLSWKIAGTYAGPHLFRDMKAVVFFPPGRVEKPGTLGHDGSIPF